MTWLRASIRVRLTLWYAAVLLLILACLSAGVYALVRARLERALDAELDRDFGTVATVVAASPHGEGNAGHLPGDVLFMVMDKDKLIYHSSAWCRAKFMIHVYREPAGSIGVWRSIQGASYRMKVKTLVVNQRELKATVAEDTAVMENTLRSLLRVSLLSIPAALLLSILGGYFVAGRALAPVSAMAAKSREISAEALSERLPVGNPNDELGRMATVFNETLARLEASFERLRSFTGNVSHELRTPLTVIRSVGEVALQQNPDADTLRDVIGSILEEVQRLTRLVDCLLEVARTESGRPTSAHESVDLAKEATVALELVRVLADEKRQTVSARVAGPAIVRGDATMLRQALLNLLDNAIRYTPEDGVISLTVGHTPDGQVKVEVQDSGPGIPVEDRERIFERFYRCQTGAAGSSRGTGLGLALTRSAVEAAGGRLQYEEVQEGGSRFRIVLDREQQPASIPG